MLPFPLSPQGTDPAADLYKFAEEMKFHKKLSAISLGQGQVKTKNKDLNSSSLRDWADQLTLYRPMTRFNVMNTYLRLQVFSRR